MRRASALIVVALVAVACRASTPVARPSASDPAATASAAPSSVEPPLSAPLPRHVEGYELHAENDMELTVDQAAALDDDPTSQTASLEQAGYRRGHLRLFTTDGGDAVQVGVYELRDEAAARALQEHEDEEAERSYEGQRFPVPGIPGASGMEMRLAITGTEIRSIGVSFVRGPRLYFVAYLDVEARHTRADASTLARTVAEAAG